MVNYQTGQYTIVTVVDLEQGPHILSKKVEIIEGEKQGKGKQNKSPTSPPPPAPYLKGWIHQCTIT